MYWEYILNTWAFCSEKPPLNGLCITSIPFLGSFPYCRVNSEGHPTISQVLKFFARSWELLCLKGIKRRWGESDALHLQVYCPTLEHIVPIHLRAFGVTHSQEKIEGNSNCKAQKRICGDIFAALWSRGLTSMKALSSILFQSYENTVKQMRVTLRQENLGDILNRIKKNQVKESKKILDVFISRQCNIPSWQERLGPFPFCKGCHAKGQFVFKESRHYGGGCNLPLYIFCIYTWSGKITLDWQNQHDHKWASSMISLWQLTNSMYDTNHIIQLAKDAITRKEFSWQPSQNISQREAIRERKRKTKGKEPL